jgi:predicted DsbA family dithiol-disulfide isomerase
MKIDIVSDVSCPWCIIGYKALEAAIIELNMQNSIELHWKAFELNPHMPSEGQDKHEHIMQKYGATPEQSAATRNAIIARGAELGFAFNYKEDSRVYNTFDAHRLIHWSDEFDKQTELELALFDLYFTKNGNPGSHADLLMTVAKVGLDVDAAKEILDSDLYSSEVRAQQEIYRQAGINSVPAFIINGKHLISGGQPKEIFVQALQELQDT